MQHLLEILYEDNHIIALNKPSGLLTQPTEASADSLEMRAKAYIKERDCKKGNVFLHSVHRLDSHASGIVLFAKSQKALSRLSAAMREQEFQKEYVAIVEGSTPPKLGIVIDFLHHGNYQADIVPPSHPGAKRAELVIISCAPLPDNRWKLGIILVTGRYHQIRAQLSAHGFPIIGDGKYGSRVPFAENAIALHHSQLSFPHPTLGKEISLVSLPPF
jgi:23S rRNA pseudouridine1911/1915/1917 synthase